MSRLTRAGRVQFLMDPTPGGSTTAGGGTGTPPPTTTPPAGGSAAGAGASGAGDWYSNLPAEDKGFVQNKGYKDLGEAIRSHRNLETLMGAPKERLLKLPEKADDKAGWDAVYTRLGRPEKADGYDPKSFGEGTSEGDAKWLQETFHGLNLTKAQGEQLAQKWAGKMKDLTGAMETQRAEASNQQLEALKQEWGANYEEKVGVANKVAAQLGIDDKQYEAGETAFGVDGWAKMLSGMAEKFGISFAEAGFVRGEGGGGNGKLNADQAKEELNRLTKDPEWVKRFMNGGAEEKAKMDELHKVMFPGTTEI